MSPKTNVLGKIYACVSEREIWIKQNLYRRILVF